MRGLQVAPGLARGAIVRPTRPLPTPRSSRRPTGTAGEVPKAFVVLRDEAGSLLDPRSYVADRVARHKRIRRIEAVDEIPRSPSGKILRRVLVKRGARGGRDGERPMSAGGRLVPLPAPGGRTMRPGSGLARSRASTAAASRSSSTGREQRGRTGASTGTTAWCSRARSSTGSRTGAHRFGSQPATRCGSSAAARRTRATTSRTARPAVLD